MSGRSERIQLVSYGVDLEALSHLMREHETVSGDMTVMRQTEFKVEALMRLRRRLEWRVRTFGAIVFSPREIEAMKIEVEAMRPPMKPTQQYIANKMRITQPRVHAILKSCDELMYYFQIANPSLQVGWTRRQWIVYKRGVAEIRYGASHTVIAPSARASVRTCVNARGQHDAISQSRSKRTGCYKTLSSWYNRCRE